MRLGRRHQLPVSGLILTSCVGEWNLSLTKKRPINDADNQTAGNEIQWQLFQEVNPHQIVKTSRLRLSAPAGCASE